MFGLPLPNIVPVQIRVRAQPECRGNARVYAVACLACGDGPLLARELADFARDTDPAQLPTIVTTELTRTGWRWTATPHATGWVCCQPTGHEPAGQ
jgi:hypothetical protein